MLKKYANMRYTSLFSAHNNLRLGLEQRLHERMQPVVTSVEDGKRGVHGVESQVVRFVEGGVVEAREQGREKGGHATEPRSTSGGVAVVR